MSQVLILMIGLPGSGKSTKAQKLAKEYNAEIISTDALRKDLLGKEGDMSQDAIIFRQAYEKCKKILASGGSVVFDACNITKGARKRVLACAEGMYNVEKIGYLMYADVWECIRRDSQRERVCGKELILSYAGSYTLPKMMEGFNQIIRERFDESSSQI